MSEFDEHERVYLLNIEQGPQRLPPSGPPSLWRRITMRPRVALRKRGERISRRMIGLRRSLLTDGAIGDFLDRLLVVLVVLVACFAFGFLFTKVDRTAGIQLLGVLAVAIGTYRTLQVNREGQLAERFSRAITQIAADQLDSRLGGIYSLERIAHDSPRDHGAVIEVLTAYARKNYRYPHGDAERVDEDAAIRAIASVLGRRRFGRGRADVPIDLSHTDLTGVSLADVHLAKVNLAGACLRDADLSGSYLFKASFVDADLSGAGLSSACLEIADLRNACLQKARLLHTSASKAYLPEANLEGINALDAKFDYTGMKRVNLAHANFGRCDLTYADLEDASLVEVVMQLCNLTKVCFVGADLTKADLTNSDLTDARLARSKLTGAVLWRVKLKDARLQSADLSRADLEYADLTGADLSDANLQEAKLAAAKPIGANLHRANLTRADLAHADFSEANLDGVTLTDAKWDSETIWPENFKPPHASV